jgi:chromosome partitioning protein
LAVSIAVAAAAKGHNVAVIDIDTQQSAADWHDLRRRSGHNENAPAVVSYQAARLAVALEKCGQAGLDTIIIDTLGKSDSAMIDAVQAAQLVLLPIRAQVFDLRSLEQVRRNIRAAGDKPTMAILNAAQSRAGDMSKLNRLWRTTDSLSVPLLCISAPPLPMRLLPDWVRLNMNRKERPPPKF